MKLNHKTTVTLTKEEIKAIKTIQLILSEDIDYKHPEGWLDLKNRSYDHNYLSLVDNFLADLLDANEQ